MIQRPRLDRQHEARYGTKHHKHGRHDRDRTFVASESSSTNRNKLDIIYLLDLSGSMTGHFNAAANAFNNLVEETASELPKSKITFLGFGYSHNGVRVMVPRTVVTDVERFGGIDFTNLGLTGLYDAVGTTLENFVVPKRHHRTVVEIYTDGGENDSKHYKRNWCRERIQNLENDGVKILFSGTGALAAQESVNLGVNPRYSKNFSMSAYESTRAATTRSIIDYGKGKKDGFNFSN